MKANRSGYVIALVIAVVTLIGSAGMFMASASNSWWSGSERYGVAGADDWQQGLSNGMMGQGWNNGSGMMGQGWNSGGVQVSLAEAKELGDAWLATNQPGTVSDLGTWVPMGYMFTVTKEGTLVGTLMVSDDTGQVGYLQWSSPAPTASSS